MVYDARPDILFRATVAGITILEYDVISVVHVSSDFGNHFSVPLCNLHRVKHSALAFSDEVLQIHNQRIKTEKLFLDEENHENTLHHSTRTLMHWP